MTRKYDSTLARMAGNIAAGYIAKSPAATNYPADVARYSVEVAKAIIAELEKESDA